MAAASASSSIAVMMEVEGAACDLLVRLAWTGKILAASGMHVRTDPVMFNFRIDVSAIAPGLITDEYTDESVEFIQYIIADSRQASEGQPDNIDNASAVAHDFKWRSLSPIAAIHGLLRAEGLTVSQDVD